MKRFLSFVLCAAMLVSSIVFVTSAADPEVQAVINKINAIGDVHRNEALLEDQTINGKQYNLSIDSDFGYNTCYYRVDYPTGSYMVDRNNWRNTLLWDRPFEISFQFTIKEHAGTSYFGGCLGDVAWVGYMFNDGRQAAKYDQRFFVAKANGEAPAAPTTYCVTSDVVELDPERLYTMTAVFDSTSIRVYCDGVLMCDSINGSRESLRLKFNPNPVSYDEALWQQNNYHFHLYPAKTVSYVRSFEAKSLDGTINVHSLDDNIAANATWQNVTFVADTYVDSRYVIEEAKAAYMALTPPQKKEVTNYATLVAAMREYYTMTPAYSNDGIEINPISAEALAVVDLIDSIGEVTQSSESDIYTAEEEYDALTPEQQEEVYNYDVLLCSREEFDAFSDPAITQLIADINAIAPVTLESGTAIARAEADYASFNPSQKSAVTNYDDLLAYRAQYDNLCVENVRSIILAIGEVTKDSNDAVNLARNSYNALRDDLKPRLADVKPIFDSAKTDMRILNLEGLDPSSDAGSQEIRLCNNYYEIQSAAAKALVKNKAYLDERVMEVARIAEAREIVKLVNRVNTIDFMKPDSEATGLEFAGKSRVGYSNVNIIEPDGTNSTASLYAPYSVSIDFIIGKWLYNDDDNTARIMGYTNDIAFGYNGIEKKFVISTQAGFAGVSENPSGDIAESQVVELKTNVPYNITFEADENHYAVYLNGKLMVSTDKIGITRGNYFIFYPGGIDMLITCFTFVHNGDVVANSITGPTLANSSSRWMWVNNAGGWKNDIVAKFSGVYKDSGYQIETAYNRYLALPDEYKAYVTNSADLIEKYKQYKSLKDVQLVSDAEAAITAIGDPAAVTLESLAAIKSAEYSYSEVPDDLKGTVSNYADLVQARANYDVIYVAGFDSRVNAVGAVSADKFATIEGLDAEYAAMSDAQKALVTSLDTLNQLLADCAEFYKAQPVIEAIYSFEGLKTANYNDTTPIGGNVRKTDNDPYTHYDKAGTDSTGIIGTRRWKVDFDFMYTSYDDGRYATISGSNNRLQAGVDVGHGLVYIKNNTSPFETPDPESYDVKDPYTFRTNRWYHVTVKYDGLRVSVEINGEERAVLELSDFYTGDWYIMKPHGGVHGYIDNMSASTLVPAEELDEGFVTTVYQEWSGGSDNDYIPETTIGQWNRDNVARARAMYNELSPFARTAVTNYKKLTDAEQLLRIPLPSDAAMAVIDAINALSKDSTLDEVNAVKAQYEALSEADKNSVTNANKISELLAVLASEEAVADVIAMIALLTADSSLDDIKAAQDAYDALPATHKDKVDNYAHIAEVYAAKAQQVTDMIAALTVDSTVDEINAVSNAFNALPDDVKALVTNSDQLAAIVAAKENQIAVANVEALINALDATSDYAAIKAADDAYKALTDEQKAQVTNYARIAELYAGLAKVVEDMIAALGNASSQADIDAAEAAYLALPEELKALVPNYAHLEEVKASHISEAALAVIDMIMELDVNSTSEKLNAALAAYNALSDADKAAVWNYDTLAQIFDDKAVALDADIEALPDIYSINIYNHETLVNRYMTLYNALPESAKAKVTGYEKLKAAFDKIAALREEADNKKVNILNSTLAGLGKYTPEKIAELAAQKPVGIYYYFEEVDLLEKGDSTTGYYSLEGDKENFLVRDQKYAKLDFDIKVTDLDFINGWPAPFKMTVSLENGWIGYDYVNKTFFYAELAGGGGGGMDHGYIQTPSTSVPCDFNIGVWNHMTVTFDHDTAVIELNGEKVFECKHNGIYDYLIIYPWLCNLEMANVYYYDSTGAVTLSPFRNAVNEPTGWSRSSNDPDYTMLDLVKDTIAEAKAAYAKLTDGEKAQIVGYENIEKLEKMIENAGKYEVAVEAGSADVEYAAEGDVVTITAGEAPEGMVFDKWEIVSGEIELADVNAASTSFTMPAANVSLKATYKESSTMPGDVDGNGKLNAKDVVAIMKHLVGATPAKFNLDAADYDGNGNINAKDVTKLMKYLVANP